MKPMNLLHDLIREVAANEIMPYFLRVQSARKEDGSVLSQADLAAQAKLVFRLPQVKQVIFRLPQWFSGCRKGKIKGVDCISKQGIVIYLRRFRAA